MLLIMLFIPNMLLIMLFILNMLLITLFILNTLLIMLFIFNMLSDDSGVQGLIKFSATVLGPGDIQKVHDPVNEEKEAEEVMSL